MKFVVLDDMKYVAGDAAAEATHDDHHNKKVHRDSSQHTYADRYHYLDELLEKTFITDYFMVRNDGRTDSDKVKH